MQMILTATAGLMVLALMAGCQSSESHQDHDAATKPAGSTQDDTQTQPAVPAGAQQVQPLSEGEQAAVSSEAHAPNRSGVALEDALLAA